MKDLFEHYQDQPDSLKEICDKWSEKEATEGLTYKDCKDFLKEVEAIGYTFDYGLSAEPFNLRKLDYYFLFIVPDSIEYQANTYEDAKKKADELNEDVYLCIYDCSNTFNEVYDEVIITNNSNIEEEKNKLIESYKKLTSCE